MYLSFWLYKVKLDFLFKKHVQKILLLWRIINKNTMINYISQLFTNLENYLKLIKIRMSLFKKKEIKMVFYFKTMLSRKKKKEKELENYGNL